MSPPLVGVNLCWLVPGVVGGSEESICRALVAVADLLDAGPPAVEVRLYVLPGLIGAHPEVVDRFDHRVAPVDGSDKGRRVLVENSWLPRAARDDGVDLLHHAGGVVPPVQAVLARGTGSTLTVHDLQPLDLPAHFGVLKRAYLGALLGRSARGARRVAVPSEFTRGRVVDRLGVDPSTVDVVPWCRPPAIDPPDTSAVVAATARHGVGARFLLHPAITYPHKGHLRLLDAFDRVADEDGELHLVLTGGAGPTEDAVAARVARSPHRERVHRLGRVPREELESLYGGALAVVFPSDYEGFGLPALEAMTRRVPVVVSAQPALVEVVGDAGLVVAGSDVAALADALQAVATDPDLRSRLAAAGAARAATFDPGRTAEALLRVWTRSLRPEPTAGHR